MKKLISLLLVLVILLLSVGCNSQEQQERAETHLAPLFSNSTGLYSPSSKEYDNTYDEFIGRATFDAAYVNFNKTMSNVTDVVKATFLGTVKVEDKYFFNFKVKQVVKGTIEETEISVYASPMRYDSVVIHSGFLDPACNLVKSFSTGVIHYEPQKDYLLLLNRVSLAYAEKDFLMSAHVYLIIPLDSEGDPDIENSKMYGNNLISHVRLDDVKERIQNGGMIDFIIEATKDNPTSFKLGGNPSYETDTQKMYDEATYILIVKPQDTKPSLMNYYSYFGYDRTCKVTQVIKGELDAETFDRKIPLPAILENDKPYLIMLDENYLLISRSAIFPLPAE